MDDYPRSKVAVRELSHTSQASSISNPNPNQHHALPPSPSFSKTSSESSRHSNEAPRSPSSTQNTFTSFGEFKPTAAFDPAAPPPYREEDYRGKSEEEVNRMRKRDYAIEISRMMGRQLVRGMGGRSADK